MEPVWEPIAIVGIGCRFLEAKDPERFWELLRDGVDAIGDVPADCRDARRYYDADPGKPGTLYVRQGGFLWRLHCRPLRASRSPLRVPVNSRWSGCVTRPCEPHSG